MHIASQIEQNYNLLLIRLPNEFLLTNNYISYIISKIIYIITLLKK